MAVAAVEGFHAGGVATCAKHFPGLGNTTIDTHEGLVVLDTTADELFERDMIPYQAVIKAGAASIMTTQTIFRSIDPTYPVTLSPVVVNELLRKRLRFDGLVTTDCMEMHATSYSYAPAEAAVLAALAGMDTILFSHTYELQQAAINGLQEAAASGRLPLEVIDRANERIARFKARFVHPPQGLDHIRSAQHLEIAREAGRRGCVLLKSLRPLLPVTAERVALVEFASALESTATEKGDISGLASLLQQRFPRLKHVTLKVVDADPDHIIRAWELAESVDLLILATRNAHLYEFEESFARSLIELAPLTIVLCLRDPHDAEVLRADVMLATCGDAAPSLEAVVDILSGAYQPDGVLPITLEDLS
jgi:beta-N-acetylhexosaminidase